MAFQAGQPPTHLLSVSPVVPGVEGVRVEGTLGEELEVSADVVLCVWWGVGVWPQAAALGGQ